MRKRCKQARRAPPPAPSTIEAGSISGRLVNVHLFTAPAQHVISRRRASEPAELIVVMNGVYRAYCDGAVGRETVNAVTSDVVYWPQGAERLEENDPARPTRCLCIYFEWIRPPEGLPHVVRDADHVMDLLASRLLAMKADPIRPDLASQVSQAYLNAILAEYVHQAYLSVDQLITRVIRYIEEHIAEPFTLGDLARHVGLEKHHFGRKYRNLTGRTPMSDVRQRKAEHARRILVTSPQRLLRDVARRVGVKGESQLSRLLSRYAGVSAREIRRASKARDASR